MKHWNITANWSEREKVIRKEKVIIELLERKRLCLLRKAHLKIPSCSVTTVPEVWKTHIQAKTWNIPPPSITLIKGFASYKRENCHDTMPRTSHLSTTFPRSMPCTSSIDKWEQTSLSFLLTLQLCIPHSHYISSNPLQKTPSDTLRGDRQGPPLAGCIHCQTAGRMALTDLVSTLVPSPASSPLVSLSPMEKTFQQFILILLDELLHETLNESLCLICAWNPKWAETNPSSSTELPWLSHTYIIMNLL